MKRIICLILAATMLLSAAIAESVDLSSYSDDQLRDLRAAIDNELAARQAAKALESGVLLDGDVYDYHVTLISIEKAADYKGDPVAVLNIQFTNNSSETEMFMTAVSTKVFQNGVQLERGVSVKGVDTKPQMLEIRPGGTIAVQVGFLLTDENAPIEVEIGKLIDFSEEPIVMIGTFDLK